LPRIHPYPATRLWSFAMANRTGGFVFNARTPESARDFQALLDGHCSNCPGELLIVVAAEAPDNVLSVILGRQKWISPLSVSGFSTTHILQDKVAISGLRYHIPMECPASPPDAMPLVSRMNPSGEG
jgi:hypothetical protein